MDLQEMVRRGRRVLDGNYSPRKLLLCMLVGVVLLLYLGPYIIRILFGYRSFPLLSDSARHSLTSRISGFKSAVSRLDAHILYTHPKVERHEDQLHHHSDDEELLSMPLQSFAPYVGNGYIGSWLYQENAFGLTRNSGSSLYIKQGRNLNQSIPFDPILSVTVDGGVLHQAIVSHYTMATITKLQAWEVVSLQENHRKAGSVDIGSGAEGVVEVTHRIYAHRTIPSLLVQDILVSNSNPSTVYIRIDKIGAQSWRKSSVDSFTVKTSSADDTKKQKTYNTFTGTIPAPVLLQHHHAQASSNVIVISVATQDFPKLVEVGPHKSHTFHILTAVNYSTPIPQSKANAMENTCREAVMETIRSATKGSYKAMSTSHTEAWGALWRSGLSMVTSRAEGAVNGDLINATLYNVLSQVRAPLQEVTTSDSEWSQLNNYLSPSGSEGCYQGHFTLQAPKLWSHLSTPNDVNSIVSKWLMTLELQGCHNLVRAGADGVIQAMLLSFGAICFRNLHLEFNTQAGDLHRDLTFRGLSLGVDAKLNLTVEVQDHDLKPVLWVTMEGSNAVREENEMLLMQPYIHSKYLEKIKGNTSKDSSSGLSFYACDGGCLDPPIKLGGEPSQFPVKLTDPQTAVLYITSDREHMEQLKDTIHVREVNIAPGHQQSVIALHRHGHRWGRLPVLFWFTIALLIVIFHLFLLKLVANEYCGTDSRIRYRKFSDF